MHVDPLALKKMSKRRSELVGAITLPAAPSSFNTGTAVGWGVGGGGCSDLVFSDISTTASSQGIGTRVEPQNHQNFRSAALLLLQVQQ